MSVDQQSLVPAIRGMNWLLAAVLVVAVFLAYQPVWQAGFIWDDDTHLVNNPVLAPGGLARAWVPGTYINYWPVTFTAYWAQYKLWGLAPAGFHLVSIGLQAVSAILLWRILVTMRVPGALFAAALFALHPVNVESVAWITQQKNTLSLSLTLLSVLLYFRGEQRGDRWLFFASVVTFALATLAKGMTLTLPVVLLACAWWQRGRITRRDLVRMVPFVLIALLVLAVELHQQHAVAGQTVVRSDGIMSRTAVAGCAVWFYLWKLIWPVNLLFVYPRWNLSAVDGWWFLPGLLLVAIFGLAWRWRHSWGRPVVMLWVCYLAVLLPVLGFVNIYFMEYSLVTDHWQYAAMIVPCAVFAGAVAATWNRRQWNRWVGYGLCLGLLATLGALTWRQSRMYTDVETLYRTTIDGNPDCWMAENNLGLTLVARGRPAEAMEHYRKALTIRPDYAEAHYNFGLVLARTGHLEEAKTHYLDALKIRPELAQAHNALGNALAVGGRLAEAIPHYGEAARISPKYADAHYNLANALTANGRLSDAVPHFRTAAELMPGRPDVQNALGVALLSGGHTNEAAAHFRTAVEIEPNFAAAHCNLGVALNAQGQQAEAVGHYRRAVKIRPNYVAAMNDLAWLLATSHDASVRNGAEAVELGRRAEQLTGGKQAETLDILAAAYAEAGQFPEAAAAARRALDLATRQNNQRLAEAVKSRLALYEAKRPFHEQERSKRAASFKNLP